MLKQELNDALTYFRAHGFHCIVQPDNTVLVSCNTANQGVSVFPDLSPDHPVTVSERDFLAAHRTYLTKVRKKTHRPEDKSDTTSLED